MPQAPKGMEWVEGKLVKIQGELGSQSDTNQSNNEVTDLGASRSIYRPRPAGSRAIDCAIVSIEGHDKSGKGTFALSAPSVIEVISLDESMKGIIDPWARKGKQIILHEYRMPGRYGSAMADAAERAGAVLKKVKENLRQAAEDGKVKTVVVDTEDELWELMRVARFGKDTADNRLLYAKVNLEYEEMLREPYRAGKNVILTRKVTEIYAKVKGKTGKDSAEATGEYKGAGYKNINYLVQVKLEAIKQGDGIKEARSYWVRLLELRMSGHRAGETWGEGMNSFPWVMAQTVGGTPDEWGEAENEGIEG